MTKHKFYNEIVAWASGAEIEFLSEGYGWQDAGIPEWYEDSNYRIKQQPKEPKYLYVWHELNYGKAYITANVSASNVPAGYAYLGKIEVQDD